jgi:transcription-repair coupling factor (superfamily II helicase)
MKPESLPNALADTLAKTKGALVVSGAPEGYDAAALAAAASRRGGVTLFVARDEARTQQFEAASKFFRPELETLRLPAWDTLPYDRISPAQGIAAQRCAALTTLARRSSADQKPLLVIATASAVAQRVPPRQRLAKGAFSARAGAEESMAELESYLVINGYSRASTVRAAGEFAVRGGLIDVFPPGGPEPLRFDFFGDELENIRAFDAETQISKGKLKEALLTPVSEILLDDATVMRFRRNFAQAFGAVSDAVYDSISARIRRQGVEQWLPFFYERLETVFDYCGEDALVAFDALADEAIRERVETARDHYDARKSAPVARGASAFRAPEPDLLYLAGEALSAAIGERPLRRFTHFDSDAKKQIDLGGRIGRDFAPERQTADANVFEAAARHMAALMRKRRVLIAAWSDGSAERLAGVLEDHGVSGLRRAASWREATALPKDAPALVVLPVEHGFETETFALIAEQDILGDRLARPRKRRKASSVLSEAAALTPGDLIVHQEHGVGRYEGLKTLDVQGAPHDCLDLAYAGGDKLYLPVENIELVTRYGSEDPDAQLDRLGGVAWQSRKARAKQRLRDMAAELIRIAAARAAKTAEVVLPPEGLWDEFCARFPYEETDDQLAAIDDVLSDLAAGRPMDRLICGDVGFGKTEVALRAAFLMAMSGRQVAVVAPTTLLCRQHFRTFSERFRGLPVRVRQLSRLVSARDASETKAALAQGAVEIIIGTHALLSKTVQFRDLGLMIIDEEQHFGVKHKERLKELRADIHVLTLSATPIPRTLQLSLAGIREMSLITTPPVDRMAVRTYVMAFDTMTVREALLREKYRGGQSFFVTPRIADLDEAADFLRRNVPEVTFAVAHGQMASGQLDEIMTSFYDGAYDVLLSTSIVESGLDIPRANTLIVFRADMFGLAQLYQLRGRVGRSKVRAYAYLTTVAEQALTAGAEKRLKVLASLDNLGAGFTLASHDLDMRGGGNLLGEEQSGHIREVGVELYQTMLEEAVTALRDGREEAVSEKSWSPQINVGASVLIPEDYVADLTVRLSLYRRLADLDTDQEREAFAAELIDRFGPLPEEANQLIAVAALKALCRRCNIAKLDAGPKGAVLTFREEGFPDTMGLVRFVTERPDDFKMRPDGKLVIQGGWPDPLQRLKALRGVLEALSRIALKKAA